MIFSENRCTLFRIMLAGLFVTLARLGVARVSGMTETIAARCPSMTFAGSHAHGHGPLGTCRKALELDRRKGGLSCEKGQSEKREEKRGSIHGRSVAQFVRGSQAPSALRRRPDDANQSPAPPDFQAPPCLPLGSENQRAASIDCSTASLGQQSTFNPADFW